MNPTLAKRRLAFSLVELVVTTGILGILIAAALPAILGARSHARMNTCQANMRQLTLGVLNYESARARLPAGGWLPVPNGTCRPALNRIDFNCFPIDRPQEAPFFSWLVSVLPYVGEHVLYDQFDFSTSVYQQKTNPQANLPRHFVCPSARLQAGGPYNLSRAASPYGGAPFSRGNYAVFISPIHVDHQTVYPGALGGFTPRPSGIGQRIGDITDGVSNTLVLSEVRSGQFPWDARGAWALPLPGSTLLAADVHTPIPILGGCYEPDPLAAFYASTPNQTGPGTADTLFVCVDPARASALSMPCGDPLAYLAAAPRSLHQGGVNATHLDSSHTFLSNGIDVVVYAQLVHTRDVECPNAGGKVKPDRRWRKHRQLHQYE